MPCKEHCDKSLSLEQRHLAVWKFMSLWGLSKLMLQKEIASVTLTILHHTSSWEDATVKVDGAECEFDVWPVLYKAPKPDVPKASDKLDALKEETGAKPCKKAKGGGTRLLPPAASLGEARPAVLRREPSAQEAPQLHVVVQDHESASEAEDDLSEPGEVACGFLKFVCACAHMRVCVRACVRACVPE